MSAPAQTSGRNNEMMKKDEKQEDVRTSNILAAKGMAPPSLSIRSCCRRRKNQSRSQGNGQNDSAGKRRGSDHKRWSYYPQPDAGMPLSPPTSHAPRSCIPPPVCSLICQRRRILRLVMERQASSSSLAPCSAPAPSSLTRASTPL